MKKFTSQEIKEFISKPLFEEKVVLNSDASWPKLSIVTPSYNQGQFVERTILSVLNQNYPNLQYIVIDGGSKDGSVEIIKKYEKYLAYWVSEKDKGQSDAINKGFQKSNGEILSWLNADDLYSPSALSTVGKIFESNRRINWLAGNACKIDENENVIEHMITGQISNLAMGKANPLVQSSTFFTKKYIERVGYLHEKYNYAMDWDLWLKFRKMSSPFTLDSCLSFFRVHKNAKTYNSRNNIKLLIEHLMVLKRNNFLGSYNSIQYQIKLLRCILIPENFSRLMKKSKILKQIRRFGI